MVLIGETDQIDAPAGTVEPYTDIIVLFVTWRVYSTSTWFKNTQSLHSCHSFSAYIRYGLGEHFIRRVSSHSCTNYFH